MPIKLIIANRDILSPVICNLVNQSLNTGIFPDSFKIAQIVPIFKRGDSRTPSNYRPISILPYLSKIFEKIIYFRLAYHLAVNEILSPYQFGFRKNISTVDALIHFTEMIYDALNNKNCCLNVLVDYSRAFDTINHAILLRKLERYGVRGSALEMIRSYLKNRQQSVRINNSLSGTLTTNISVPQGSILGPLLFLIYVNEISNMSNKFTPTSFADDCTITFVNSDINTLISDCNEELYKFKSWSDANRLTINIDKTHCLFISNTFDLPPGSIMLENNELELVSESKFLGVMLDNRLKYDKHTSYICKKISKSIGILYRIRRNLPSNCLRFIYFSLIHPYLLYCLPIFGAAYTTHLEPLRVLQKKAIRIISNAGYLDHTNQLFFSNKILKFDDMYKHSLGCYIYKNQDLLTSFTRSHNYNTRNRELYLPPFERLRSTEQSVLHQGIRAWNNIPDDIKACRALEGFKHQYKQLLINQYAS